MRILSAWFGFAGIMFLLAILGFYAMPNLHVADTPSTQNGGMVSTVSESTASFSYWSTIGLVIAGVIFLILGSYETLVDSRNV